MKYILVPTDFSATAKNAYYFALEVAQKLEMPVHLLHCYLPEVDPAFPYMGVNAPEFLNAKEELIQKFKQHTQAPHDGGVAIRVEVTTEIAPGYPTEEITKRSRKEEVSMVIMGATGEHGLAGKLFGSVSTFVSRRAHCPVLLVPNGTHFEGFKHILFASSSDSVREEVLKNIKELALVFGSTVHFVHVRDTDDDRNYQAVEERIFDYFFGEDDPVFAFNMEVVHAADAVEGLNNYTKWHPIDLAVMVSPKRGLWEKLLHRSATKAMALNSEIPLLIYHEGDR